MRAPSTRIRSCWSAMTGEASRGHARDRATSPPPLAQRGRHRRAPGLRWIPSCWAESRRPIRRTVAVVLSQQDQQSDDQAGSAAHHRVDLGLPGHWHRFGQLARRGDLEGDEGQTLPPPPPEPEPVGACWISSIRSVMAGSSPTEMASARSGSASVTVMSITVEPGDRSRSIRSSTWSGVRSTAGEAETSSRTARVVTSDSVVRTQRFGGVRRCRGS